MPKEDRMKYKPKITYMGEIGIDQGKSFNELDSAKLVFSTIRWINTFMVH